MEVTALTRMVAGRLEGAAPPKGASATTITGITHNSAWVQPGYAFVAVRGHVRDGHDFVADALARGAALIVGEGWRCSAGLPVPYLRVANARHALGDLAAALHGHPSHKLTTVGVTGTKGKTTTTWLVRHLLRSGGHRVGMLSTLGYKLGDDVLHQFPAHFTTPEAPQVQETLARMVDDRCTHAAIEASSEALAQSRLRATRFDVAIWTNLQPEHLNFHGDMEGYFQAKRMLIDGSRLAVLNTADPWGMRLADHPHVTYGHAENETGDEAMAPDWAATAVHEDGGMLRFTVQSPVGDFPVTVPLIGRYNIANILAALAAASRLGVDVADLQAGLAEFPGVPGRMQVLAESPARVVLDFAHTPDSLQVALESLRQTTRARLIAVLGSAGGPRDPGKRAPLGAVAATLADLAIFTEEDCRDTPIYDILNEMQRGAMEAGRHNTLLIPDRLEAIRCALADAAEGDTVVFCGKAGEITLERADEVLPWDEETIVRREMRLKDEGRGMKDE